MHWPSRGLGCLVLGALPFHALAVDPATAPWGNWSNWGDQLNGSYLNPVLPSDYSDLDCIKVGADYYAISSTFQFSPGMVILHSRDLVNWTIRGHAVTDLTQISPEMNWDRMNRSGKGIWAGAIRHHDHQFWIYFGTADEGYFVTSAPSIDGPWAPLHSVLKQTGWDDCCPFWDDDGQGWFVGTNFRDEYKIHLWKLTPDGQNIVRESDQVIYQSKGSEANKLYKFNGVYYHFFSEVHADGRAVMMQRASKITGPYSEKRQLKQADRAAREPNQGAIVEGLDGHWYFLTHHGTGSWEGRAASLLPVTWIDGWPILGHVGADGIGAMAWTGKMPVANSRRLTPQSSDEFDSSVLSPQWEWNYQPRQEHWSLNERTGWLRLHAFKPLEPGYLLKAGNTLTQRCFRTRRNEIVVEFDLSGMTDGQQAGLCHFAQTHSAIGVIQSASSRRLVNNNNGTLTIGPDLGGSHLWLKSTWGLDGKSRYAYSTDGAAFTEFGEIYPLAWGNYRGDRIGLYCFNDQANAGFVDINFFHYRYDDGVQPSQ